MTYSFIKLLNGFLMAAVVASSAIATHPALAQPLQHPKKLALKQTKPVSTAWLRDADDDSERFRRIELYLGGSQAPMMDIGQRYLAAYQAISDENLDLAHYQFEKLVDRLNGMLMKRPQRTASAEALFLDPLEQPVKTAFKSRSVSQAQQAFLNMRNACMACHVAEKFGFINGQPMFGQTASFVPAK